MWPVSATTLSVHGASGMRSVQAPLVVSVLVTVVAASTSQSPGCHTVGVTVAVRPILRHVWIRPTQQ